MNKIYQSIVWSCGGEQAAQDSINSLVKTFANNQQKRVTLNHMLDWVNKELKNPSPVEGCSLDEKIKELSKSKEELEPKIKEFDAFVDETMKSLREKCNAINPNLYNYANAKFMTMEMMGEIQYQVPSK